MFKSTNSSTLSTSASAAAVAGQSSIIRRLITVLIRLIIYYFTASICLKSKGWAYFARVRNSCEYVKTRSFSSLDFYYFKIISSKTSCEFLLTQSCDPNFTLKMARTYSTLPDIYLELLRIFADTDSACIRVKLSTCLVNDDRVDK